MLTVINKERTEFTGTQYTTWSNVEPEFHANQGELCIDLPYRVKEGQSIEPNELFTILKNIKLDAVQVEKRRVRDSLCYINVNGESVPFDADAGAMAAYTQYKVCNPGLHVPDWKASTGVYVTMTALILLDLQKTLSARTIAVTSWQRAKEAEIKAVVFSGPESIEELERISVLYG